MLSHNPIPCKAMDWSFPGSSVHGIFQARIQSGLPFAPPGDLPNPHLLNWQVGLGSNESACNMGDPGLVPGRDDALETGMAAHSSVLAWRMPWTEEPGKLQSIALQGMGL